MTALAATVAPLVARAETLKVTVESAVAGADLATSQPIVTLILTPESRIAIGAFTTARVGEQVKMRLGDTVLSEPFIREPIKEGTLVINGGFTEESARTLADLIIKAGGTFEVDGSDK